MIDRGYIASLAARNLTIAVFLWVFSISLITEPWSFDIIVSSIFISAMFGLVGFVFAAGLLVPLESVFLRVSGTQSFLVFLLVGSLVPMILFALINLIFNSISSFEEREITDNVFAYGALGAITAASAWWHLTHRGKSKNGN